MTEVRVIGAGLAGSEAAWQLAERGFAVRLSEMKPVKMTPAHHCADFAELVCSNSLRGDRLEMPSACSRRSCGGSGASSCSAPTPHASRRAAALPSTATAFPVW